MTIKEKIKTVLKLLSEPKVFYSLVSFRSFGYLLETGWFESFKSGEPVDADLKPIPWFTYSAIEFISDRLNKKLNVFEFGSGNSTLFFAERVSQIISVEHNRDWYENISKECPANSKIVITDSKYSDEYIKPLPMSNQNYDIIVVDGINRNECLVESAKHLSESGVIILDDSERDEYLDGIKHLLKNGFRQINFSGIAPGVFFRKCTSIFYKNNNCLNI